MALFMAHVTLRAKPPNQRMPSSRRGAFYASLPQRHSSLGHIVPVVMRLFVGCAVAWGLKRGLSALETSTGFTGCVHPGSCRRWLTVIDTRRYRCQADPRGRGPSNITTLHPAPHPDNMPLLDPSWFGCGSHWAISFSPPPFRAKTYYI